MMPSDDSLLRAKGANKLIAVNKHTRPSAAAAAAIAHAHTYIDKDIQIYKFIIKKLFE